MEFLDELLRKADSEYEQFVDELTKKAYFERTAAERAENFFSQDLFADKPLFKERFYLAREKRVEKVLVNA